MRSATFCRASEPRQPLCSILLLTVGGNDKRYFSPDHREMLCLDLPVPACDKKVQQQPSNNYPSPLCYCSLLLSLYVTAALGSPGSLRWLDLLCFRRFPTLYAQHCAILWMAFSKGVPACYLFPGTLWVCRCLTGRAYRCSTAPFAKLCQRPSTSPHLYPDAYARSKVGEK